MAAENYSDVVQTLARQIVDTCLGMLNSKVGNIISTTQISGDQITGDLSTSQLVGFDEAVGYVVHKTQIDIAQIANLEAAVADIAQAYIDSAEIDTAQIRNLSAEVARIAVATIQTADIDWANINGLTATTANIADARIGVADIDYSHVKNLVTDTSIITQGVGGKLYITDLAVTEANMVSLTVGELMVKGTDGSFYSVSVDENGEIVTAKKMVVNSDIQNLTIDGDAKLIEGSITAKTLNVQNIFAQTEIVKELIAANIDVDTLFARQATVDAINTIDITGNTYLRLMVNGKASQDDLDALVTRVSNVETIMTDEYIIQTVTQSQYFQTTVEDAIQEAIDGYKIGARNYIMESETLIYAGVHYTDTRNGVARVGYAIVGHNKVGE